MKNHFKIIGLFALIFTIVILCALVPYGINKLLPYSSQFRIDFWYVTSFIGFHRNQISYSLLYLSSFTYLYTIACLIFLLIKRFDREYLKLLSFNYAVLFLIFILNHFVLFFITGEYGGYLQTNYSWLVSLEFLAAAEIIYIIAFFISRRFFKKSYQIIKQFYLPGLAFLTLLIYMISFFLQNIVINIIWTL